MPIRYFEETTKEDEGSDCDLIPTIPSASPKAPVSPSPKASADAATLDTLTKENYPSRRSALRRSLFVSIIASILAGVLLSAIPLAVIVAAFSAYEEKSRSGWIISFLFGGGGLISLGIIWYAVVKGIRDNYSELQTLHKNYRKLLSEEELACLSKKKRKRGTIALCIVGLLLAGLLMTAAIHSAKQSSAYDHAVSVTFQGSYAEAKSLLEKLDSDYRDTASLIALCESHINYDSGRIPSAYYDMNEVHFYHLTPEQAKAVNEYMTALQADYDKRLEKLIELGLEAYRYRISNGVPYVGMSESEIKNTSLGAPSSKVRHNHECIGGKQYLANLYDFKVGSATIFIARCVNGTVTQVWDYRNDPIVPYTPKKSTTKEDTSDPYDVNDYANEEDFYYDHYDDFFDYYDAEDYYNEHHE